MIMRGAFADGDQIRTARVSRGLTQEQLATRAEVDVKTVRKAEQGKRLDAGTLARLAMALAVDVQSVVRAPREASAAQTARRTAVEQWIAAWDAHDIEALLAVYHERAAMHLPGAPGIPFSGTFTGKREIRQATELAWASARTAPQGPECYTFITSGDTVMFHGAKGVYLPSGDVVPLWCAQIFTFDRDFVIDHRVEYDTLSFSQALGLPQRDDNPPSIPETSR